MADFFGKLVVRAHAPKRRAVLLGSAALLAAFILYAAFELGRYDAGFRVVDSVRGALAASRRIRDLEAENARLNQDLSFYRGLVQPDSLVHVKVQQMQIVPDAAGAGGGAQYRLKFVLMQTGKPASVVAGSAAISIDGLQNGK